MTDCERDAQDVILSTQLYDRLVSAILTQFPRKSFGYLVSTDGLRDPVDFVLFKDNVRNNAAWRPSFESYGRYFVDHDDAGFVAAPEEAWKFEKDLASRRMREVAVFHTHQRHPANFSGIDYDMHVSRFSALWHLIISLRNPMLPQVRAFAVDSEGVSELALVIDSDAADRRA